MALKAGYLLLGGAGMVFVWSGVRGKRVSDVFRGLIGGEPVQKLPEANKVGGVVPTPVGVPSGTLGTNSSAGTTTGTISKGQLRGYANPISHISGILDQRVDQGVDFTGHGPIYAIGDGIVRETNGGGWPGGPFMSYTILAGPAAGKTVYVAEQIMPTVHPGDHIAAGQQIAVMSGYIEMGWANAAGTIPLSQTPEAGGITGANLPPGGTLVGRNFESFLRALGANPANNLGSQPGGMLPAGYPNW